MNSIKYPLFILLIIMNAGCMKNNTYKSAGNIEISWELIGNFDDQGGPAKAELTINNESDITLEASNWLLYFNMAPRNIIPATEQAIADIMHINGDWYKLVPRNNFRLPPNEKITITYLFQGYNIKESDAPLGLYFVFYNDKGEEEATVAIEKYSILPFDREDQIRRSPDDRVPLPTPENRYAKYEKLQLAEESEPLPMLPSPMHYQPGDGVLTIDNSWIIQFHPVLSNEASYLHKKLTELADLRLKMTSENIAGSPKILLNLNQEETALINPEAYVISMNSESVSISGQSAGVFYGIQSLLAHIPYEQLKTRSGAVSIPRVNISDAPRFAYRGQHIDVCRNFQTKEQLMKVIDLMASYKLNRLHLYLTEDEAWRLEIKALPELTEIGSRRGHTTSEQECLPPAYGSGPFVHSPGNHGTGFYTREEYIEILQYAWNRHVQVIPSINLPGHARAAIKAMEVRYNLFMEEGREDEANAFRLIDPEDQSLYRSAQFYNDNVVCVARESVYHFYETVIDEVIAMYNEANVPLEMINTGGDEVPEGVWTRSPMCAKLMEELPGIKDPKNLQRYFFGRITQMLNKRGLQIGGWEEIVLIKQPDWTYQVNPEFAGQQVVPYIWNNLDGAQDLAYRIANSGYPIILCPVSNLYFDLAYDNDPQEPGLYWNGFNDERDAWEFAPYNLFITTQYDGMGREIDVEAEYANMERLLPDSGKNILGLQAQLWHESIRGGDMMEHYLLPKMIGFAERCWAAPAAWENLEDEKQRQELIAAQWKQFSNTIYQQELPKLSLINGGYNYRIPKAGAIVEDGMLVANAICPELTIRYTQDGSEPTAGSAEYLAPIPFGSQLKLKVFDKSGHSGSSISLYPE